MALTQEEKERRQLERKQKKWDETHKLINGIDHKMCGDRKEFYPATTEYFYNKNVFDGLDTYCKTCAIKREYERRKANPEEYKARMKIHNANRSEKSKAAERRNAKTRRENGKHKAWLMGDPNRLKRYAQNRSKKNHIISDKEWMACKTYFNNSCAYCGLHLSQHFNTYRGVTKITDLHREHVNHCGSAYLENCVPSCKTCNNQKWEFSFEEWYSNDNPHYTEERCNKIIKWMTEDYKLYFEGYEVKRKNYRTKFQYVEVQQ